MQLDSSLAKQTQMKWLLNDFLGNLPRQHKPSIWSLLFPSLSPVSSPSFSSPNISIFLTLIFCHFSCVFFFDLLALLSLLISTVIFLSCVNPFCAGKRIYTFLIHFTFFLSCLDSCLFCFVAPFTPLLLLSPSDLDKHQFSICQTF